MKKKVLILVNLMLSVLLSGQETQWIIRNFNGSQQIAEKYSVLKSDGKTKHGAYFLYFQVPPNQYKVLKKDKPQLESYIKIKGNYNMGQKQGDWEEYEQPFLFKTKGKYWKDKKVGIWQIAREYGQVVENFNYDTGQKLLPHFNVQLHYPEKEMESGMQGTVIIRYKTSKECTISEIVVLKSLSQAFDKAAIQWVNRLLEFRKKYGDICEEKNETQELKFN